MSDKIIIAGRLNIKGWHNKACKILNTGGGINLYSLPVEQLIAENFN